MKSRSDDAELEILRSLLVGPEQAQLARLAGRLDDPRAKERDLREGLRNLIAREPDCISEPMVPVVLPLIRHALMAQLRAYLQSVEALVEQTLTLRAVRWRWIAWRTGTSISDIALQDADLNRLDRLLLMHRPTGIALAHAGTEGTDPDLVSGLITAVTAFAREAFVGPAETGGDLERMELGERELWILRGRWSLLVAEVHGIGTERLRARLAAAHQKIETGFEESLSRFDGDEDLSPRIAPRLAAELSGERRPPARWPRWIVLGGALLFIGLLVGSALWSRQKRAPIDAWAEALEHHPGVILLSRRWEGPTMVIEGLKDPLAPPLPAPPNGGVARTRWRPFASLDPEVVLRRASAALAPPPSVRVELQGGSLVATGTAPAQWVRAARVQAASLLGVRDLDASAVRVEEQVRLDGLLDELRAWRAHFPIGAAEPDRADLDHLGRLGREADQLAGRVGRWLELEISGGADPSGRPQLNRQLSKRRAEWLEAQVERLELRHARVVATIGAEDRMTERVGRIEVRIRPPVAGEEPW